MILCNPTVLVEAESVVDECTGKADRVSQNLVEPTRSFLGPL